MPRSYDWGKLEKEYVHGPYDKKRHFARAKSIPEHTLYKHSKDWNEKRAAARQSIGREIDENARRNKLLTADAEAMIASSVIVGIFKEWRDFGKLYEEKKDRLMRGKERCPLCYGSGNVEHRIRRKVEGLDEMETYYERVSCVACAGVGEIDAMSENIVRAAMWAQRAMEQRIVEVGKFFELVQGRATERSGDILTDAEFEMYDKRFKRLKADFRIIEATATKAVG